MRPPPLVSREAAEAFIRTGVLEAPAQAPAERPRDASQESGEHLADAPRTSASYPESGKAPGKPRAAAGTAAVVTRARGPAKRRRMVYLPLDVSEALEAHSRETGEEYSETIARALRQLLQLGRRGR